NARGQPLEQRDGIMSVAFSRDGRRLLVALDNYTAQLWDVDSGKSLGPPMPCNSAERIVFTTDDRTAMLMDATGCVCSVRQPTPLSGTPERIALWFQVCTGMHLDASGAAQPLDHAGWQERRRQLAALGGPLVP